MTSTAKGLHLSITPSPVPAGREPGSATVDWDTGGGSQGEVRVSRDGADERVLSRGAEGTCELAPVVVGSSYVVRLYVEGQRRPAAERTVTRNFWPRPREGRGSKASDPPRGDMSPPTIDLGDLRRTKPISIEYGYERGQPVDRYYIEEFLGRNSDDIHGRVLEVQDASYSMHFGADRVTSVDVLDYTPANPNATLVADLNEARSLPVGAFDCVVLTQTIPVIYELESAISNLYRSLRDNGVLLATFPGISQLTERPGEFFWRLAPSSARRLFAKYFPPEHLEVHARGNVLAAAAFLYGIASDELELDELDEDDPRYDVVVCVRAVRRERTSAAER
jgi:SAM-dependent methyltransferase